RLHRRRGDRVRTLPPPLSLPRPPDDGRDRPGPGPGDRLRPPRLLPQRLLLRRRLPPPLGHDLPPGLVPLGPSRRPRPDPPGRRPLPADPPDPDLRRDRRPGAPAPPHRLLP